MIVMGIIAVLALFVGVAMVDDAAKRFFRRDYFHAVPTLLAGIVMVAVACVIIRGYYV